MLTQLQLTHFKSYRQGTLPLGRLTVLIGANASGKSNAIEALRLLSRLAEGERLNLLANPRSNLTFRGDVKTLGYSGINTFQLACSTTQPEWQDFEIQLAVTEENGLQIIQEKICSQTSTVPLYQISSAPQGRGSDVWVSYNNFARGGKKPTIACSSQMAIFTQLLSPIRFRPENSTSQSVIPDITGQYQRIFQQIFFLEPEPSAMRSYSHVTEKHLKSHGENLSGVLYNLCQDTATKQNILKFIQSLPEQQIADLEFLTNVRGEVLLELTETFGNQDTGYDAALLSDGTLRVLAIAAVLLSAPEESLVVIEEIDNGVHPSRASALLEQIMVIAEERNLRVLISSHNPALLDALPDAAVPDTVFCYRDPQDGSSRLVRLQDLPDYPELIAQGSIGHLMSRGLLERFVKQQPSPVQKREKALAWLASLENLEV